MAQLSLAQAFPSGTDASIGVSSHEPDGKFWTYRVNEDNGLDNSMAQPDTSVFYPFAVADTIKPPVITITPVDNMGVKKFIGWGAGAYYHPIDSEYSYLVLPIHKKLNEQEPPEMTITNNGNTVIFNIEQGAGVIYETVRLTVQQGNLREEKVVYFETGKPIHYEMVTAFKNLVTASVRAHANEINIISELVEEELNLGGTLEAVMTINQQSASLFNHDFNAIGFSDDRGMSIENQVLIREIDGQYSTEQPVVITETSMIPKMTSNTAPSGTATASSAFDTTTYAIYRAFDQTPSSFWSTTSGVATGWIAYEFTSPQTISKYTIQGRSDAGDGSPKNWTFEGWNGVSWVVLDTRSNETAWSNGEKRAYSFSNEVAYSKYQLNVTANNGRATLNIAEIEMIEITTTAMVTTTETLLIPQMTSDSTPSGTVTTSSVWSEEWAGYKAFDRSNSTYWCTSSGNAIGWIAYEFTSAQTVSKYTLRARDDNVISMPKNWTFEAWTGSVWTVLDTVENATGWSLSEKRSYSFSNDSAYIKYRLNVSENNGHTLLGIAEIEMIEITITGGGEGAIIKTIPIPDQSTYGDDFVISVDEV